MNRRVWLFIVALLAGVLLVGRSATVRTASAALEDFNEAEPNDSVAQAQVIGLGVTHGAIGSEPDVDFYRLNLMAGQSLHLFLEVDCASELWTQLSILDANSNILFDDSDISFGVVVDEFVAPTTGTYYVRVTNPQGLPFEETGNYHLFINVNPAGEPFDSAATATTLSFDFGDQANGVYDWPNDKDTYRFDGEAGQVLDLKITTAAGNYTQVFTRFEGSDWQSNASSWEPGLTTQTVILPYTGSYTIATDILDHGSDESCSGQTNTPLPYVLTIERRSLYVSANKGGTVNGFRFGTNDILAMDETGKWLLVFDGEDVGVNVPISDFELFPNSQIVMSFAQTVTLPGVGKVTPWDIVRYAGDNWGTHTTGDFYMYLRGADVGLKGAGARIDAIALNPDQKLVISTTGNATLPKFGGGTVRAADEDLMRFHATGTMPSAGKWSTYLDGSAEEKKLAVEDIWSATILTEENSTGPWNASYVFTLNSDYTHQGTGGRTNVLKGNLFGYDRTLHYLILQPTNNAIGFPRPISGLAAGPGY